jgi:hypothetical protein
MMTGKSPPEVLRSATLLLAAGACLHLVTALFLGTGNAVFRAALCAWSLAPYGVLWLASRRRASGAGVCAGALLILLLDTVTFWSVFIAPQHSTAALGLLWAPLWNLLCVTPLALVLDAWLARRRQRRPP